MEQYESRTRLYGSEISENLLCCVICSSGHKNLYIADVTMSYSLFNGSMQRHEDSSFINCYPKVQVPLNIVYLTCYKFALLLFFRTFLRKYFYIRKLESEFLTWVSGWWISDILVTIYCNKNITLIYWWLLTFSPF